MIGKSAFENCSNLVEVVLGNDVEIKDKAFSDCTKLATVNLNVLDYYAPYAFNNTALTNIVLADNSVIAEGAFANIKALLTVDAKNATIGDNAFINAESLTNVIINTDTIGAYAFANAKELSTIDLSKVTFNKELCLKFTKGYLEKVKDSITDIELTNLINGALIMTYECGLRFLTDYLNNNCYFKIDYPFHNLIRCKTQICLCKQMMESKQELEEKVLEIYKNVAN